MSKDFNIWNERKKMIENRFLLRSIKEREVWWCSIGLNVGNEQDGKNESFERSVLVVRKFNRKLVLVVPLTSTVQQNYYRYKISHNNKDYSLLLSQIKAMSTNRFNRFMWKMDETVFNEIIFDLIVKLFLTHHV